MKKLALITALTAALSVNVKAIAAPIPHEIYKPNAAQLVKADSQGNGEFEVEYRLDARKTSVAALAKKVISHAQGNGFRLKEKQISHDDADLKFKRGSQELDVSIELKNKGQIEYKADLDLDKN